MATIGGGPKGAAMGPGGKIYVTGSRVDRYMLPDMMVTNTCFGGRG
jgi:hypothetical protein